MIGRLTIGTIGFGKLFVSGLNLVPKPPAIITHFTSASVLPVRELSIRPSQERVFPNKKLIARKGD
jgi:hypothetical protein